jgi:hypothetical protein
MNKNTIAYFKKKPLTALIEFTPGLGEYVEKEILEILADPWIPEKESTKSPKIVRHPEKILIHKISLQSILAIAIRSFTIKDIFIQITETFDPKYIGDLFIDPSLNEWIKNSTLKMKYIFRKNPKLDGRDMENSIRHHLDWKESNHSQSIESSLPNSRILISVIENKANLFLALREEPIYRRGFRVPLKASYPLAEDIASVLLKHLKLIGKKFQNSNIQYSIPFCGTGTLGWEAYMQELRICPGILRPKPDPLIGLLAAEKEWGYLMNKALLISNTCREAILAGGEANFTFALSDRDPVACDNAKSNRIEFNKIQEITQELRIEQADFFETGIALSQHESALHLLPFHPPYGIRSDRRENSQSFYGRIAEKIKNSFKGKEPSNSVAGFLLIPDATALSAVMDSWKGEFSSEIIHFSQGKLSIRALFFWEPPQKNP